MKKLIIREIIATVATIGVFWIVFQVQQNASTAFAITNAVVIIAMGATIATNAAMAVVASAIATTAVIAVTVAVEGANMTTIGGAPKNVGTAVTVIVILFAAAIANVVANKLQVSKTKIFFSILAETSVIVAAIILILKSAT